MTDSASGDIQLWLASYDQIQDARLLAAYRDLLTDAERAPEIRFHFASDQRRYKESYIKARGMGLSIPLDKFSFRLPDDHSVELSIDADLADNARRWCFWQFRPSAEYLVAVCAERSTCTARQFEIRTIIPLHSEQMLAAVPIRTSK